MNATVYAYSPIFFFIIAIAIVGIIAGIYFYKKNKK